MKWTLLNGSTGLLSSTVDAANFDFKDINRSNQTKTLEDRALQTVNGTIGEALGKLYVEKCFLLAKEKRKNDT
jgi:endothelin-converting enzyme/putative endopeptidase